jgi:hypothetical protein
MPHADQISRTPVIALISRWRPAFVSRSLHLLLIEPSLNQRHATRGTESRSRNALLNVNSLTKANRGRVPNRDTLCDTLVLGVVCAYKDVGSHALQVIEKASKRLSVQSGPRTNCRRTKQNRTAAKILTFTLRKGFLCGQSRCQSGLSAVRG